MHAAVTKKVTQPSFRPTRRGHGLGCEKLPKAVILVFDWLVVSITGGPVQGSAWRLDLVHMRSLIILPLKLHASRDELVGLGVLHANLVICRLCRDRGPRLIALRGLIQFQIVRAAAGQHHTSHPSEPRTMR